MENPSMPERVEKLKTLRRIEAVVTLIAFEYGKPTIDRVRISDLKRRLQLLTEEV